MSTYPEPIRGRIAAELAACGTWLFDRGYTGATGDESECALDPSRAAEALEMPDHWEARCGLPAHLRVRVACLLVEHGDQDVIAFYFEANQDARSDYEGRDAENSFGPEAR